MGESASLTRHDEFMLNKEAQTLLMKDNHAYQAKCQSQERNKEMDYRWIQTVLSKGTLADKIAASTILIQDSPKNNLSCLERMIEMVNPKCKREALMAMDALKELFLSDLLQERKLRPFAEMISGVDNKEFNARKQQLINAYYEDQLRQLYRRYIESVEHFTHDSDSQTKSRAIKVIFELLTQNGEQEQYLLEKLVNKLGDPEARGSALVIQLLTKLVNEEHPAMKEVVVKEVERVLYRTNVSQRAQYCALCFLSSIKYVRGEYDVANRVVKVFLSFFKALIKKKTVNSRTMAIILSGLTRSHPFSNLDATYLQEQLDTIYKVAHLVNFNVAIQAYSVIFAVITKNQSGYLGDRYSCALYRSLLEPNLDQCSKRAVYLNLLYKSLKEDSVGKRIFAFVRRFLQISLHQPANINAAFLMLISSTFKDKPEVRNQFLANFNKLSVQNPLLLIDDDEDEEEHFQDQDDDQTDTDQPSNNRINRSTSDKEDHDHKTNSNINTIKNKHANVKNVSKPSSSWVHVQNTNKEKSKLIYDPLHRNPLYANADVAKPFELCSFRNHFHPSVAHFTEQLLTGQHVQYDGDALYDFNVKSFLDKFVYKNPKKVSKTEKKQAQQQCTFERNLKHKTQRIQINGPGYVSQLEQQIPVEERFIYNFLKNKSQNDLDDNASVSSLDFDRFVLTRFEKSFDNDLSADIMADKKKKRRTDDDDDDDDDVGDYGQDDDDFGIDFEMDQEYQQTIKGLADDLGLNQLTDNDQNDQQGDGLVIDDDLSDDDDDDEDDEEDQSDNDNVSSGLNKKEKNKKDKNLMDLFASADEFAHLLEDNEDFDVQDNEKDDHDLDAEEDNDDGQDDDEEDALDFDDDQSTLDKRRSKTEKRKKQTEKEKRFEKFSNKNKDASKKRVNPNKSKQSRNKSGNKSGNKFGNKFKKQKTK